MSNPTIAEQVVTFNEGFTAQVGPRLADVFAREQADLLAAGVPAGAVRAGDPLPDADLLTAEGTPTGLHAALGDGPAVLVFYRGAWCPYCNLTLREYQANLVPALAGRGASLVAISPQTPDGSRAAATGGELGFPVLSDSSAALIRRLGLLTEPSAQARAAHTELGFDVADSNADGTAGIPFPTVLVVDADRVVRFADVHVDYTSRTEVPAVLAAVDAL
ncbi:peroxiredoxin-like family protein [Quadrisphaera sp. DSM 44207]|uniref:peroxiredoxin-like family protein n=1 Tax=Quadrisphaera sp. DSM 44207 TaxID=1881057 RepID=UPI000883AEFE|nr:peroxiredoxin-like family protein [Quadrisphaera sp. DSM 44207]SDQ36391.1 Peroxiredoxin [Quadrisphaera sp. DSM 44207]